MNPILALIIANIIWGFATPIIKGSIADLPTFVFLAIRFVGVTLLFLPFVGIFWKRISAQVLSEALLAIVIGSIISMALTFSAIAKIESINVAIILSASPVVAYISSILFFHERPKKRVLAGLLTCLVGILVVMIGPFWQSNPQDTTLGFTSARLEGYALLFAAMVISVATMGMRKRALEKIPTVQFTFLQFLVSALCFSVFAAFEVNTGAIVTFSPFSQFGLAYTIILSSVVAYLLYNYGFKRIAMQEVGLFQYVDPIAAVVLAIPLLHEFPDRFFAIGAACIFLGIYIAEGRIHYHPLHKIRTSKTESVM